MRVVWTAVVLFLMYVWDIRYDINMGHQICDNVGISVILLHVQNVILFIYEIKLLTFSKEKKNRTTMQI